MGDLLLISPAEVLRRFMSFYTPMKAGFRAVSCLAIGCLVLIGGSGCMSYAVKGGRAATPAGSPKETRFTVSKLEVICPETFDQQLFGTALGWTDTNLTCNGLNSVLCRERPDLFVQNGGIPFGVMAYIHDMDWPGRRYGTFAAYILTLGCWPISLEGRLSGDAILYAPTTPQTAVGKSPLLFGYKCNISVFTPIGLIGSVNGFPNFKGESSSGCWPVPDPVKTRPVFLSEITRAVADGLTPAVQKILVLKTTPTPSPDDDLIATARRIQANRLEKTKDQTSNELVVFDSTKLKKGMTPNEVMAVFALDALSAEERQKIEFAFGMSVMPELAKSTVSLNFGSGGERMDFVFKKGKLTEWPRSLVISIQKDVR